MNTIENYINSGILELYVLGITTEQETLEISLLAESNEEIKNEIIAIETALQIYSEKSAPSISPAVKAWVTATIDYSERLKNGEEVKRVPLLDANSETADFDFWLNRTNMQAPDDYEALYAKIIEATPQMKTLIVWLKYGAPPEVHDAEFEHFLIVEGTCDITIGDKTHSLIPGDYLSIPLVVDHNVRVTSETPCKIILQRIAA
jgi:mannose-6-phosphate isomerase-like protein (cupin superfamily)